MKLHGYQDPTKLFDNQIFEFNTGGQFSNRIIENYPELMDILITLGSNTYNGDNRSDHVLFRWRDSNDKIITRFIDLFDNRYSSLSIEYKLTIESDGTNCYDYPSINGRFYIYNPIKRFIDASDHRYVLLDLDDNLIHSFYSSNNEKVISANRSKKRMIKDYMSDIMIKNITDVADAVKSYNQTVINRMKELL